RSDQQMALATTPLSVRRTLIVSASPQRSFDVFTAGMSRWWLPGHHIGASPFRDIVVEPRAGGRWYELGEDGSQCEWGKVLAWEPPTRLLLAWQLDADWNYNSKIITEIEVRFSPEPVGTRIDFEHRHLERLGPRAAEVKRTIEEEGGWTGLLRAFA